MVKRKRKTTTHEHVDGVRVNRDHLEAVVSEAEERGFDVTISDDEYEYESVDELIELRGRRPKSLQLAFEYREDEFSASEVILGLDKYTARIHGGLGWGNSDRAEAFSHWLIQRTESWVPWYRRLLQWQYWAVIAWLAITIAGIVYDAGGTLPRWFWGLVVFVLVAWPGSLAARRLLLGINLYRRHEANLWVRNKDRILTLAIGTALGVLFSHLFQSLF